MRKLPHAQVVALARDHGRTVFAAAYRVLGSTAEAEDIQQNVFLRLLEKPQSQADSWPAFLTTLATRLAIDRLRRQHRWKRLSLFWPAGNRQRGESADQHAGRSENAERLRQALARLRKREAQCFTLRCIDGMDIASIARTTGMSRNHVSVTLHRAVRALEAELGASAHPAQENRDERI